MSENKISITAWEYEMLVRSQEKIRILERLFENADYVTAKEVKAVLGIKDGAVENG